MVRGKSEPGRPKLNEHERRSETLRARVTLAEQEYAEQQAAIAGLGVSEYVRRRTLDYVVPAGTGRRSVDPSLVVELNRLGLELKAIGQNANQIARSVNAGRPSRISWDAVIARIMELGDEVESALVRVVDVAHEEDGDDS